MKVTILPSSHGDSMQVRPPMICVLCGSTSAFSSEEHIVPNSLGNDLIILPPGWVCDSCNNICSAFESRALSASILGLERCLLRVITKKHKPAKASLYGVTWFAEPTAKINIISADAEWDKIPVFRRKDGSGKMAFPLHDKSNADICRLLLKMGIELLAVHDTSHKTKRNCRAAKEVILGNDLSPWPYFVLRDKQALSRLKSVFDVTPDVREYIRGLGFDLYLHEVENEVIFIFQYDNFLAATSLSSRSHDWIEIFNQWGTSYLGCPFEFAHLHN